MSDRYYSQMLGKNGYKAPKIKRILKSDYISELNTLLNSKIEGLEKCTIKTLQDLIDGVKNVRS